jgi:DNA-binding transcriptional MerR regulator
LAKGAQAFRTISEAADEVGVPQHVLRFWETKFPFIHPVKRAGGRRFYRPQDVAVLKGVKRLLHDEGLTIKGVQKLHADHGVRRIAGDAAVDLDQTEEAAPPVAALPASLSRADLEQLLHTVTAAERRLAAALNA